MKALKNTLLIVAILTTSIAFSQKKELKEVKFKSNVECNTCKGKIEKHMSFCKGVKAVNADVETKTVTLSYDASKTDEATLMAELEKTGYGAELIKSPCCSGKEAAKCKEEAAKSKCCDEKASKKCNTKGKKKACCDKKAE